jgi:endonuclease III
MGKGSIEQIINLLVAEYGDRKRRLDRSPISVLINTILSQNTSDKNSDRAFESLLASFGGWDEVADASIDDIADAIRIGGLSKVKARYIKRVLEQIRQRRDGFNLEFLKELPLEAARDWLRELQGVGMKTASCVLLFSLGMPAFPVDTHVFRVTKRLGFLESKSSVEKAHYRLESLVPPQDVYRFHVLLIEHGRKVCKAQRPRYDECVLCKLCPGCGGTQLRG